MVPLHERYFGISKNGITTKGINMLGTHPQSCCECTEELTNVGSRWRGFYQPLLEFTIPPFPLPFGITTISFAIRCAVIAAPGDHQVTPLGCAFPSLGNFGLEGPQHLTQLVITQVPNFPYQFHVEVDISTPNSPSSEPGRLEEAACQVPYPGYMPRHQMSSHFSQQYSPSPTYPSEVDCREWWACPIRWWLH